MRDLRIDPLNDGMSQRSFFERDVGWFSERFSAGRLVTLEEVDEQSRMNVLLLFS